MHVDWTINVGTIIQTIIVLVAAVGGYFAVMNRLNTFNILITFHTDQLAHHAVKMGEYERDLRDLVASMQRITAEFGMFLRMRGERRVATDSLSKE